MEAVSKMARRRGSDAGQSRRSDPAEGVCNSPSVLSCIGKRTREGYDRGSEVGTVHSAWDGEGPVPPRKPKESGREGSCEKDFVSTKSRSVSNLCNGRCHTAPTSRRFNVGGAVLAPLSRGGPKWWDNYPEWSDIQSAPIV